MTIALVPPPEQGQVVVVRNHRYVVADITPGQLPPSHLHADPPRQHLLTLNSLEDDRLGETLQVIWELEPGAQIVEAVSLPELSGFDPPARFDAFLDAVRWGAISASDTRQLQAPFRSGIEIEDYQLDPLVRAIQMPRVNLLIADDVGLGKTVEAGLVVQELIVRARIRTVLIVCPAGLQIHWRDQMRDKFGLEFRIVDSDLMKALRRQRGLHVNPWAHFPRLITSVDFVKRDRPMRLFKELLPSDITYPRKFDLLIVDEAHNIAPTGSGKYALDSLRTLAIRALAPHFEHKLFLSATPHNGYAESFTALLELLDNQRFARGVSPAPQQLERIMVRRLKSDIKHRLTGQPRFPQRRLEAIEVTYTPEEKQVHQWLRDYSALRQRQARDAAEKYAVEFVLKLLKKRLFSSPAAFASTLACHLRTLQGQRSGTPRRRPTPGILRRQIAQIDEEYADDEEFEEAAEHATVTASALQTPLSPEERALLNRMQTWAEQAAQRPDSKARTLLRWLKDIVKPGGRWSDERVIIFTEYRTTQNWLQQILAAEGLATQDRLLTLYGGMPTDRREAVKAAFQADPAQSPVRILLATDAASEGIDLQKHCHRLVHLEIPWNPNRLEQRNGRIDRHGQQHDPLIYHFVAAGYQSRLNSLTAPSIDALEADLEFLMRVARKVEQIREDLGKVGPVIAEQVEEAMLGRRAQLDTGRAEADATAIRRLWRFERDLTRQIEALYQQVQETQHALRLTPDTIHAVVAVALQLAGQPPLEPAGEPGAYHLPALSGSWAACAEGLAHPFTGEVRPISFDHKQVGQRDNVVLAHLNHRLVHMALRLLRAEVWSPATTRGLHRVTARLAPDYALSQPAVIAHARLVVVGGDSHRLHEEIIAAGGFIQQDAARPFRRFESVADLNRLLELATAAQPTGAVMNTLQGWWPALRPGLIAALEARMRDRTRNMEDRFIERAEKLAGDIETILNELAQLIRTELAAAGSPQQLQITFPGFNESERAQLTRNIAALQARLAQIPAEITAEKEAIMHRFFEPTPRLFPVAVTFLVPESLA